MPVLRIRTGIKNTSFPTLAELPQFEFAMICVCLFTSFREKVIRPFRFYHKNEIPSCCLTTAQVCSSILSASRTLRQHLQFLWDSRRLESPARKERFD